MICNEYDLTNQSFRVGRLGQWSVLNMVPIVAGDSIDYRVRCVVQQSPLRRQIVLGGKVDIVTFFCPHRLCTTEDNWRSFVEQGVDTTVTFPTLNVEADARYLPWAYGSNGDAPFFYDGIRQAWMRYLRPPSSPVVWEKTSNAWAFTGRTGIGSAANWRNFGPFATALPDMYNGGVITDQITADDYSVDVDNGSDSFSILDLARVQARYKTEVAREYFGQRYKEVLKEVWGPNAPDLVEDIPELLRVSTHDLDGQELRSVGDQSLGQPVGVGRGVCVHDMPRRYFDEHGCLWTLAVIRYPHVYEDEGHFLTLNPLTYKTLAGDPDILDNEGPMQATADQFFINGSSGVDLLSIPYGQWYRHHPNIVDPRFGQLNGYPFRSDTPGDQESVMWFNHEMADKLFASSALGHHQFYSTNDLSVERVVPPSSHSLFAGSR